MIVKLMANINELKAKLNTIELENELLKDKRINQLIEKLDEEDKYKDLQKKIERQELKIQTLKEIINGKAHK